jgi:hypothetical protein
MKPSRLIVSFFSFFLIRAYLVSPPDSGVAAPGSDIDYYFNTFTNPNRNGNGL